MGDGYKSHDEELYQQLLNSLAELKARQEQAENKITASLDAAVVDREREIRAAVIEGQQLTLSVLDQVKLRLKSLEEEQKRQATDLHDIKRIIVGDGQIPGVPYRLAQLEAVKSKAGERMYEWVKWGVMTLIGALAYFLGKYADKVGNLPP